MFSSLFNFFSSDFSNNTNNKTDKKSKKHNKILHIHIPVVNNPSFIELQVKAIKKFCLDPFKITIFNDAKPFPDITNFGDVTLKSKIEEICKELNIDCINIDNANDVNCLEASARHCRTANFMWQNYQYRIYLSWQTVNPNCQIAKIKVVSRKLKMIQK